MSSASAPHRRLDVDTCRLCYRDDGAGPAVVLVHGWLLDSTMWDRQVPAWSSQFRVLRLDRRGCGASGGVPSLADDADDVVRLLDHLRIPRAAVLGMSQGARIALRVADVAAGRVACLVLDGPPALAGPTDARLQETPLTEYRELLLREGIEALRAALARHPLMRLHTRDATARQMLDAMLDQYRGADLLAPPGRSIEVASERLAQLDLPVLLLNGALDSAQRLGVGAALAALLPSAERHVLPHAGHLACLDQRETYNATVLEFLNRNLHRWA